MALSKKEQARYERENAKLLAMEEKQSQLRAAGMSKRHPEYQLLQKERDTQFRVVWGHPVECICGWGRHGDNPACTAE